MIQNERTGALSTLNNQSVVYCLQGNGIDRADTAGCNGKGWRENQCYTLNTIDRPAVCIENHPADSRVKISDDGVVQTLSSRMGTGGGNVPMVIEGINGNIAGTLDANYYKGCGERQGIEREVVYVGNGQLAQAKLSDKVGTLNCMHDQQAILENQSIVRRLTPLECERLQGYPDNWTFIGMWRDTKGKLHKDADSPRYKALGNSIALPFWQWMADRMVKVLKEDGVENPTMGSLFDGIGGFPLVYSRCGCEPVWASEIEEFPIAVTKLRFPDKENTND